MFGSKFCDRFCPVLITHPKGFGYIESESHLLIS